ncbi:MAG: hypothetical protein HQM09_18965 [Candidatus Riflebacteria bacterium]|nr:hypothetical protein [Candidatus Riflebacteria bacterium]
MWPKWLRGAIAGWVYLDSSRREGLSVFWFLLVLLLGPFLLPAYLAARPLFSNEERHGSFLWNAFWHLESLFALLAGFASVAVFVESIEDSIKGDYAKNKRAEILAGSIFSLFLVAVIGLLERIGVRFLRYMLEASPIQQK